MMLALSSEQYETMLVLFSEDRCQAVIIDDRQRQVLKIVDIATILNIAH